jgi:predicted protein tyrosine phosphatase
MKFIVTDRSGIESEIPTSSSYIVISIHDSYSPPARVKLHPGLHALLQLAFDDAVPTRSPELKSTFTLMTSEQADTIWRFVDQHSDQVGAIVVHCEAGWSRSPAVAAALCKTMGGNDHSYWRKYDPNRHVYRLMLEASRKRRPDEKIKAPK